MRTNNNFSFTIIIPFYETINYVEQTLRSIFNQENFPIGRVQVLLIDDGSPQKIEPILTKLKNEKFQIEYHRKINANWGGVINFVKNNHLAKGDYITVLDSDDVLTPNCLFMIEKFINEFHPDMLIPDYYEWSSIKDKRKRIKTIWKSKNKFWQINNKNINKLKTPYVLPIAKFYKSNIFYKTKDLKENIAYQDGNFYYENLYLSKTCCYIHSPLGMWRNDRIDSTTNIEWTKKRVDGWINVIKTTAEYDAKMNAYFFLLLKGFIKAYKIHYTSPIVITNKLKNCYLPKILIPASYLFIFILRIYCRKVIE